MTVGVRHLVRMIRKNVVVAFAAIALIAYAGVAVADEPAGEFVQEFGNKVVELLKQEQSPAERREEFRRLLTENFDLGKVSRAALGLYSRRATDEQLERYRTVYVDYVIAIYSGLFAKYAGETITVTGSVPVPDGDVLVRSRIDQPNGPPTVLAFRVRGSEDGFKVLDIMVEGISMLVTQRSDFASVIRREGIDGFLDRMQEVAQRNSP